MSTFPPYDRLLPLLVGVLVNLAWAAVALALAYRLFLRRDFTDLAYEGSALRTLLAGALPLVGLVAACSLAVAGLTPAAGSGMERAKLEGSLSEAFAHLYRLQTDQLHRPDVTEAQLDATASCDKGGSRILDHGPGNDWRCVVSWHLPDSGDAIGTAIYQLDVTADGRFVADGDGPKEVNGYFQVRTPTGDAPNRCGSSTAPSTCSPLHGRTNYMHVTRQRSAPKGVHSFLGRGSKRTFRTIAVGTLGITLATTGLAYAGTKVFGRGLVGQQTNQGLLLPSDQAIAPIGDRLLVNNGKLLSSTISPDGHHLAALTNDRAIALTIVDLDTYQVQQQVGTDPSADLKISANNVGQEGPSYSPGGQTLWMPQINGFTRFLVSTDGTLSDPTFVALPVDGARHPLPTQAVFSEDGSTMYVTVNGQNTVVAMDPVSGTIEQTWAVGNAPRDLALVGDKLYVSNEGGRPAKAGDTTLNSYGTDIVANPVTGASTTGTVSVIDLAQPAAAVKSIGVGLHPTAMHAADGALFVADTNSDEVSVIDTDQDVVTQTIATQPWPSSDVGYHPDGVTLTDDGHLLVTLGRANAVAVYRYTSPQEPVGYVGLLPTDYYPTEVDTVDGKVVVTNLRGIGERGPQRTIDKGPGTTPAYGHNTHDSTGTLQRFTLPDDTATAQATSAVFAQNGWDDTSVKQGKGKNRKAVPVPKRLGDPSTIKHVFLIVKENRSYDQVFGDDPRGNGDPSLAQFGEDATPNQHKLARQFGLYDNTYDIGTNSAEGHNWLMQADDPEYTESRPASPCIG